MVSKIARFSREPFWVALASGLAISLFLAAGYFIPGIFGIIIALAPVAVLLVVLCVVNPYPFWLLYFFIAPFTYIIKEAFPLGSFVRFIGLFLVILSAPSILLSKPSARFRITPLGASILLFLLGGVLSLLAFIRMESAYLGVGLFFGNVIAYWVFVNVFGEEQRMGTLLKVLIGVLAVQSVIAVVQKIVNVPLFRASGTITDPNYFGFWLLPFLCISFYLGVAAKNNFHKILYFVAYALMTVAISLTYSRSMILILIPTQFVLFLRQRRLLLFLAVAAGILGFFYLGFAQIFQEGFNIESFFTAARIASIEWRFYFAKTSLKMFWEHPLFGVGADNFYHLFRFYSTITPHLSRAVIHNSYLEILAGTGLAGTVPFLAIIMFSIRNFWRARRYHLNKDDRFHTLLTEGLLVGFVVSLASHLFLSTQHHILLWLFLALSTIAANLSFRKAEEGIHPSALMRSLQKRKG